MPGRFEIYQDNAGLFRFRLKAANGMVVATGDPYGSSGACRAACEQVQLAAAGAPVEDLD